MHMVIGSVQISKEEDTTRDDTANALFIQDKDTLIKFTCRQNASRTVCHLISLSVVSVSFVPNEPYQI